MEKQATAAGVDIADCATDATVSNERRPPQAEPADPDEALRVAIKVALDVGDYARVKALVAVLEATPKKAPVLDLASRRPKR